MSNIHSRRTPFGQQSRRYRKSVYIETKNQIRRHTPILGGLFTTHHYMHDKLSWIDGYFLGRKAPFFYNFALETTRNAYKELICDQAYERSYALVPERLRSFIADAVKDPLTGMATLKTPPDHTHAKFGGLTRHQWSEQQIPAIANEKNTRVFEHWTLHHDYRRGIGLQATIDVPYLTITAVNDFIVRFLAIESNFHSTRPLSYSYADIEYWGPDANAIIETDDWSNLSSQ